MSATFLADWYRSWGKRLFDIVLVGIALPFWLPAVGFLGLAVRVILGRPVFFRQTRPGLDGKLFRLMKLRSMSNETNTDGELLPNEDRVGPFGRALRSSSLDELPELVNVLRGDMSLVGPRPLRVEYLPLYSPEQARRHDVRPGLTGLAQVSGRNGLSWEEKFALDVEYVDSCSIRLDIEILARTVWFVLQRKGIDGEDGEMVQPFLGSR